MKFLGIKFLLLLLLVSSVGGLGEKKDPEEPEQPSPTRHPGATPHDEVDNDKKIPTDEAVRAFEEGRLDPFWETVKKFEEAKNWEALKELSAKIRSLKEKDVDGAEDAAKNLFELAKKLEEQEKKDGEKPQNPKQEDPKSVRSPPPPSDPSSSPSQSKPPTKPNTAEAPSFLDSRKFSPKEQAPRNYNNALSRGNILEAYDIATRALKELSLHSPPQDKFDLQVNSQIDRLREPEKAEWRKAVGELEDFMVRNGGVSREDLKTFQTDPEARARVVEKSDQAIRTFAGLTEPTDPVREDVTGFLTEDPAFRSYVLGRGEPGQQPSLEKAKADLDNPAASAADRLGAATAVLAYNADAIIKRFSAAGYDDDQIKRLFAEKMQTPEDRQAFAKVALSSERELIQSLPPSVQSRVEKLVADYQTHLGKTLPKELIPGFANLTEQQANQLELMMNTTSKAFTNEKDPLNSVLLNPSNKAISDLMAQAQRDTSSEMERQNSIIEGLKTAARNGDAESLQTALGELDARYKELIEREPDPEKKKELATQHQNNRNKVLKEAFDHRTQDLLGREEGVVDDERLKKLGEDKTLQMLRGPLGLDEKGLQTELTTQRRFWENGPKVGGALGKRGRQPQELQRQLEEEFKTATTPKEKQALFDKWNKKFKDASLLPPSEFLRAAEAQEAYLTAQADHDQAHREILGPVEAAKGVLESRKQIVAGQIAALQALQKDPKLSRDPSFMERLYGLFGGQNAFDESGKIKVNPKTLDHLPWEIRSQIRGSEFFSVPDLLTKLNDQERKLRLLLINEINDPRHDVFSRDQGKKDFPVLRTPYSYAYGPGGAAPARPRLENNGDYKEWLAQQDPEVIRYFEALSRSKTPEAKRRLEEATTAVTNTKRVFDERVAANQRESDRLAIEFWRGVQRQSNFAPNLSPEELATTEKKFNQFLVNLEGYVRGAKPFGSSRTPEAVDMAEKILGPRREQVLADLVAAGIPREFGEMILKQALKEREQQVAASDKQYDSLRKKAERSGVELGPFEVAPKVDSPTITPDHLFQIARDLETHSGRPYLANLFNQALTALSVGGTHQITGDMALQIDNVDQFNRGLQRGQLAGVKYVPVRELREELQPLVVEYQNLLKRQAERAARPHYDSSAAKQEEKTTLDRLFELGEVFKKFGTVKVEMNTPDVTGLVTKKTHTALELGHGIQVGLGGETFTRSVLNEAASRAQENAIIKTGIKTTAAVAAIPFTAGTSLLAVTTAGASTAYTFTVGGRFAAYAFQRSAGIDPYLDFVQLDKDANRAAIQGALTGGVNRGFKALGWSGTFGTLSSAVVTGVPVGALYGDNLSQMATNIAMQAANLSVGTQSLSTFSGSIQPLAVYTQAYALNAAPSLAVDVVRTVASGGKYVSGTGAVIDCKENPALCFAASVVENSAFDVGGIVRAAPSIQQTINYRMATRAVTEAGFAADLAKTVQGQVSLTKAFETVPLDQLNKILGSGKLPAEVLDLVTPILAIRTARAVSEAATASEPKPAASLGSKVQELWNSFIRGTPPETQGTSEISISNILPKLSPEARAELSQFGFQTLLGTHLDIKRAVDVMKTLGFTSADIRRGRNESKLTVAAVERVREALSGDPNNTAQVQKVVAAIKDPQTSSAIITALTQALRANSDFSPTQIARLLTHPDLGPAVREALSTPSTKVLYQALESAPDPETRSTIAEALAFQSIDKTAKTKALPRAIAAITDWGRARLGLAPRAGPDQIPWKDLSPEAQTRVADTAYQATLVSGRSPRAISALGIPFSEIVNGQQRVETRIFQSELQNLTASQIRNRTLPPRSLDILEKLQQRPIAQGDTEQAKNLKASVQELVQREISNRVSQGVSQDDVIALGRRFGQEDFALQSYRTGAIAKAFADRISNGQTEPVIEKQLTAEGYSPREILTEEAISKARRELALRASHATTNPEQIISQLRDRINQRNVLSDDEIQVLQDAVTSPNGSSRIRAQAEYLIQEHLRISLQNFKGAGVPTRLRQLAYEFGLGSYLETLRNNLGIPGAPPPADQKPDFTFPEKTLSLDELRETARVLEQKARNHPDKGYENELKSLTLAIDYLLKNPDRPLYRVTGANGSEVTFPNGRVGQIDKAIVVERPDGRRVDVIVEEKGKALVGADLGTPDKPKTESEKQEAREGSQIAKYTSTGKKVVFVVTGNEPEKSLGKIRTVLGRTNDQNSIDNARGLIYLMPRSEYEKFLSSGETSDAFAKFLDSDPTNRKPETLSKLFEAEKQRTPPKPSTSTASKAPESSESPLLKQLFTMVTGDPSAPARTPSSKPPESPLEQKAREISSTGTFQNWVEALSPIARQIVEENRASGLAQVQERVASVSAKFLIGAVSNDQKTTRYKIGFDQEIAFALRSFLDDGLSELGIKAGSAEALAFQEAVSSKMLALVKEAAPSETGFSASHKERSNPLLRPLYEKSFPKELTRVATIVSESMVPLRLSQEDISRLIAENKPALRSFSTQDGISQLQGYRISELFPASQNREVFIGTETISKGLFADGYILRQGKNEWSLVPISGNEPVGFKSTKPTENSSSSFFSSLKNFFFGDQQTLIRENGIKITYKGSDSINLGSVRIADMPGDLKQALRDSQGKMSPDLKLKIAQWAFDSISDRLTNLSKATPNLRQLDLFPYDKNGTRGSSAMRTLLSPDVGFFGPGHGAPGWSKHGIYPLEITYGDGSSRAPIHVEIDLKKLIGAYSALPGVRSASAIFYETCSGGVCGVFSEANAKTLARQTGRDVIAATGILTVWGGNVKKGSGTYLSVAQTEKGTPLPADKAFVRFSPSGQKTAVSFDEVRRSLIRPEQRDLFKYGERPVDEPIRSKPAAPKTVSPEPAAPRAPPAESPDL